MTNLWRNQIMKKVKIVGAAMFAALLFPVLLFALPEGETIIEGQATFDRSTPNTLTINTTSDKLIVDYNNFSIANNESVYFYQPSISSAALNRVTGTSVSNIFGSLIANGMIYLINPNGINIGPASNINASAFIASTLNITNADFISGNYAFSKLLDKIGKPVINQGYIKVREGGRVALLGSAVVNSGTIEATLGSVALAAGERITLNLDSAGMISVVIDEPVKEGIYGFGGEKLDSAVQNSGKIVAPGGKVILAAKVLNNVFDKAINNSGIIQAWSLVNHDGVVELLGEGAAVVNTGTIEAGEVKVAVKGADFVNQGQIIAAGEEDVPASGNIYVEANNVVIAENALFSAKTLVDIKVETVVVTTGYVENNSSSVQSGAAQNVSPGIIIQANQVRITAKQFGTTSVPLNINANYISLYRTIGNINILESLGIGTSNLIRGPPDGFGAIIYPNLVKNLTLEAENGSIEVSRGVFVFSSGILSLKASQDIISYGSLIATDKIELLAVGNIASLGELKALYLTEKGATFTVGGLYDIGKASVQNADNAITLNTGNYSGETADIANIVVNNNAVITLIGNTIFRADSDQNGTGAFTMNAGSSIVGGGFDLDIYASQDSTLRAISGVGTLSINESQAGSNPLYTANISGASFSVANLTVNSGILRIGQISSTVTGTTDITGELRITSTTGTKTFGDIIINNGGLFSFTANEAIAINGNLQVNGTGSITSGTGVWTFQKTGGGGTISGTATAVSISTATFSTTYTNSISTLTVATLTINATGFTNNGALSVTTSLAGAGTLTQGVNATLNIADGSFTTPIDASASGNTVNYNRGNTQTIQGGTYHNLILSVSGTKTAGGALTVNGDFTTSGTVIFAYGAFTHNFAGNWIINSTAGSPITATAGSTINFNTPGTPAATSISGTTTATIPFVNININNTSGFSTTENMSASGTFTVASGVVFTPGAANIISGAGTLTGNGTVQVTRTAATANFTSQYSITNKTLTNLTVDYAGVGQVLSNLTYGNLKVSGSITGASNSATVGGVFTVTGTFTPTSGTLTFNNGSSIVNSGTLTFSYITIANSATVATASSFSIAGALNVGTSANFSPSAGTVTFNNGASIANSGTLTFNNITVAVGATVTSNGSFAVAGTFNLADSASTFTPSAADVISGAGTLNGNGTVKVTRTAATADFSSQYTIANKNLTNLTVEYAGASSQTVSAITYGNLKINMAGQVASLAGDIVVTNNLNIAAGTLSAGSNSITVGGNWSNSGTFNAGTGTVIFNDNSKVSTISGSTTFNNFTSTIAGKQITFTAGTTQTISGALTLTGASGNLIILRSSSTPTQWNINPQGTRSVSFVDVKDSNNTNATAIPALSSTDSGNNTNWSFVTVDHFVITGSASETAGTSNQLTITAKDALNNTVTTFTGDQVLVFSGANNAAAGNIPTVTDKNGTPVNFGSNTTITFTNGVSSAGGLMVLYKAETANVVATQGSVTTPSPLAVTVSPAAAATFTVAGSGSQAAGAANQLTITALDQFGNTATGYTGDKVIVFSGANQLGSLNPTVTDKNGSAVNFGSNTTITFSNGVSSTGGSMILYKQETALIAATQGAVTTPTPLSVVVGPAAFSYLAITGNSTQIAGTTNSLTITAFDTLGNVATNYIGVKSLTFSGLANSPDGDVPAIGGINLGSAANITFTAGVSNVSAADLIAYKAENTTINVSDGTVNSNSGHGLALTVNPAAAAKLEFNQQPVSVPFDTLIIPAVTVRALDQFGNLGEADNSTIITILIGTNPAGGILSVTATNTVSGGTATFSNLIIDKPGVGYTLSASSAGLTGTTSNAFDITGALPVTGAGTANQEPQLTNALILWQSPPSLQDLSLYQINSFIPMGPVYLYHPLTAADISVFEEIENKKVLPR